MFPNFLHCDFYEHLYFFKISLHLYNYVQEKALLDFAKENSIVIAAFGVLMCVHNISLLYG